MVLRFRKSNIEKQDGFEKQALFITGIGLFILAAGLVIASGINISLQHNLFL